MTLLFFLSGLPGYAFQQSVDSSKIIVQSLMQVWERAQTGNKQIQKRLLEQESRLEKVGEAKTNRLPEIEAEGQYARVSKMPVYKNGIFNSAEQYPVLPSYYKVGVNAYLNLYNGNKNILAIKSRETDLQISNVEKDMTISEIKLKSASYYLGIQKDIIFRNLLLKDISAQEKQLLQIKSLQKNGVVLKSDVLKAELKISRQKLALMQICDDLAIANQKLNILLGFPEDQIVITSSSDEADSVSLMGFGHYLAFALDNAYPLKISEKESYLRELELDQVKANVSPQIGLFANYAYSYPQIFLYPYSASLYGFGMAGIKASFAISSIYLNRHKVKFSKVVYKIQQIEHEQETDNIREQVYEAYLRCKEASARVEVNLKNVKQAEENQRIVNNTYFNHFSLITDLLDADTELLQTRFDLAAAKISAKIQYYHLLNITGQL